MTVTTTRPNSTSRLSLFQIISLSALTFPVAMGMLALMMYIPTYYSVNLGLGLTSVGLIMGAGRFIDVFTDPAIGYFSDQTQSRFGPRKPWIAIGVPLLCLALWMLCRPPENVDVLYLIIATTLYFLALTVTMVPFGALGLEVSRHYNERTALLSTRIGFNLAGSMLAAALPVALALALAETLNMLGPLIVFLMPVTLILFLLGSPANQKTETLPKTNLRAALRDAWNRPDFRRLISAFALIQIGNTLNAGLILLFVTYVLAAPDIFGFLLIIVGLSTGLFLPVWYYLSKKIGKYSAWRASILLCCISLIATLFIRDGDVTLALICSAVYGAAFGCDGIMPNSILADIVYSDETEREKRLAGLSSAALGLVTKFAMIAPMGLAFPILGLMGLGETPIPTQPQIYTLIILYAAIPILFRLSGYAVIRKVT